MILVADDDALSRMATGFALEALGFAFAEAAHGREAVEMAAARTFHAVLMDIEMPVMDGRAAATAMRALPGPAGQVPIIAVTGHEGPEVLNGLMAMGFSAVLTKPITPKHLKAVLDGLPVRAKRP